MSPLLILGLPHLLLTLWDLMAEPKIVAGRSFIMPVGRSFENDFVFGPWRKDFADLGVADLGVPSSSCKECIVGENNRTMGKNNKNFGYKTKI